MVFADLKREIWGSIVLNLQDNPDHVWGKVFCINSSLQVSNPQILRFKKMPTAQVQDQAWKPAVILCGSEIFSRKVKDCGLLNRSFVYSSQIRDDAALGPVSDEDHQVCF